MYHLIVKAENQRQATQAVTSRDRDAEVWDTQDLDHGQWKVCVRIKPDVSPSTTVRILNSWYVEDLAHTDGPYPMGSLLSWWEVADDHTHTDLVADYSIGKRATAHFAS